MRAGPAARDVEPLEVFGCPLDGIRLVEASAGTGKTWNLCGLYLRLLLARGLEVQNILVVTFTNAATAELRERIRARLVETRSHLAGEARTRDPFVEGLLAALRADPELTDERLLERLDLALASFDEAAIHTIHGFCQRALADVPFAARMPLRMELLQDDDPLRHEVVADFWRRRVAVEELDPLVRAYLVQRNDSPARFAALLRRSMAKPKALRRWPARIGDAPRTGTAALCDAHERARAIWQAHRDEIVATVEAAKIALNGNVYRDATAREAALDWDALLAVDAVAAMSVPVGKAGRLAANDLSRATKKGREASRPSHPFFDAAQALLDELARLDEELRLARLRLVKDLLEECGDTLRELKRRRHVIAFDDMLYNLYERLTAGGAPWLARALRERFPAALIDEFQDTDPLQFGIFERIYGDGGTLFLVGDPKQAIYGFRNADLHAYLRARDEAAAEYTLEHNQRSTRPLLDALNGLFGENPSVFLLEGLEYRPVTLGEKRRPVFVDRSAARAALQVWMLPGTQGASLLPKADAVRCAAQATAAEIARLLAAGRAGEATLDDQPLQARHVAVLVRTHAEGARMRGALAALGVGCVELSQASVFASIDAEEVERVLAAVLEPGRSGLVKAALSTQAMGFDALEIDRLADDGPAFAERAQLFARLRETWLRRGVGVMLRGWLAQAAVARRLLARGDGDRRLTNLLHLFECLHEAAGEHPAPDALLEWFRAQRRDAGGDEAAQLRLESDRNLVQIVTVHRSKGLEYPVVFCPFLWTGRLAGPRNESDGVEYHDDEGSAVIDYRRGFEGEFDEDDVKARSRLEASAEFMRLVYVALTRAVHRCVLVAGCYDVKTRSGTSSAESTRSLLNWMVAGAGSSPAQWLDKDSKRGVADVAAAWTSLAQRLAPDLSIAPIPAQPGVPLAVLAADPAKLAAREPPARIAPAWRIGSYSGLAHGAASDAAALDHDLRAARAAARGTDDPASLADDDVLRFPRGAAAGECIHSVFEGADFSDSTGWDAAIEASLRRLRAAPGAPGVEARAPMLRSMLADVLNTPLPVEGAAPLVLSSVPSSRRSSELEFHFPSRHLDAHALNALLARHGYEVPRLAFGPLSGFLKGYIDLVLEHDGRHFVLDWKSNHLGATPARYAREPMAREMAAQGYHLQYLLYCVALHRHLGRRIPDYDYDRHFGGVAYLFVRGVRPGWILEDGAPAGAYLHRPGRAAIEELSALFEAGGSRDD